MFDTTTGRSHLSRVVHQGLFPSYMSERPDLSRMSQKSPPVLEAVLWNGGSFLISSDMSSLFETYMYFFLLFLKISLPVESCTIKVGLENIKIPA